jgi:hypothetical protein
LTDHLIAGQSIEHVFDLLWAMGLGILAVGLLMTALVLAGRKYGRFNREGAWILPFLSIFFNAVAFSILVWVASPHNFQFIYHPQMTSTVAWHPEQDATTNVRVNTWEHAIPPRATFRGDYDWMIFDLAGRVLNRLSRSSHWRWFFDRVRARLSFQANYQISYRLRLQADQLLESFGDAPTMKKWSRPVSGGGALSKIEMATITLSSTLSPRDLVHPWPSREFGIECLSKAGPVAIRPISVWISDENLKEHETFTLPTLCVQSHSIIVDVHLSPGEILEDYARLFIRTVEVKEIDVQDSPRLSAHIGTSSLQPGDTLPIKINASGPVDIEVVRLGVENRIVHTAKSVAVRPQKTSLLSFRDGIKWDVAHHLTIPGSWRPGYYVAKITREKEEFFTYFLVSHSRDNAAPPIAILVPTNTWQAYNRWGGGSFYSLDLGTFVKERQAHQVSMQRPILLGAPDTRHQGSHLVEAELEIVKWLETSGYLYTVYTDSDLHEISDLLSRHSLVVIPSHSEYWSDKMILALESYLAGGGSLAYLGGNAIYQRVTIKNDVMEAYNHRQIHQHDGSVGGFYYLLNRPQSVLLGIQYNSQGYNSYAPYIVKANDHWALDGTGFRNGDKFGSGAYGAKQYFASGLETDKVTSFSPKNLTLLAQGANKVGAAEMIIYDHPGGGFVYSVGSISYASTLNLDEKQGRILKNVIGRALSISPQATLKDPSMKTSKNQ